MRVTRQIEREREINKSCGEDEWMDMDEDKWIGLMDRHRHTQRHTHMMDGLMDGWHTTE